MVYTLPGLRFPVAPSVCKSSQSSFHGDRRTVTPSFFQNINSISRRKTLVGKVSHDSDSSSSAVAASDKVLVPGGQDDASTLTDPLETSEITSQDLQAPENLEDLPMKDDNEFKEDEIASGFSAKASISTKGGVKIQWDEAKPKIIPPSGTGQRIYDIDPSLLGYRGHLDSRYGHYKRLREEIDKYEGGLEAFSRGYEKFGFTRSATGITYREWAPGAKSAALIGDFNNWNPNADVMARNEFGVWEIFLPNNVDGSPPIPHGSRVKIRMDTPSGIKDSIPAWIKFSVQAPGEIPYNGIYYDPPEEERYVFKHPQPKRPKSLRIYESHVGMSSPVGIFSFSRL